MLLEVSLAPSPRWEDGVGVVLASQEATGLPDPLVKPPALLAEHTRSRQVAALGVWLALAGPRAVGHALVQPVAPDHLDWSVSPDGDVALALREGRLVELGGLAVHPAWTGRGVASALVTARLEWILSERPDLVVVSSVWRSSPASVRLASRHARVVGSGLSGPYDLYRYDV